MTTQTDKPRVSEAVLFGRLLANGRGEMSPELARYVLILGFDNDDQAHMRDLAARNQESLLSPEEQEELQGYVKAGHLLALLQSQARKALRKD
jgi:hypothetical protein